MGQLEYRLHHHSSGPLRIPIYIKNIRITGKKRHENSRRGNPKKYALYRITNLANETEGYRQTIATLTATNATLSKKLIEKKNQ